MTMSKRKRYISLTALYILVTILMIIILFPLYWLVTTSIKPPVEWINHPPVFVPSKIYLENYVEILLNSSFQRAAINTVVASIFGTLVPLFFGSMVAYSLARINFKFKRSIVASILLNRMIPPVILLIPYFTIMRSLHLLDTKIGLIIVRLYLMFPFSVWMLLGFFQRIPVEIDDAAKIDGCDLFGRFLRMGIPLGKVGFATAGIFIFIVAWNEFLFSMTITSLHAKTLPVMLASYVGENSMKWGPITALSTVSIIPVFLVTFLGQKYFVRGITLGAVKG
jgi:multiple sugar transport system permease protein